MQNHIPRKRLYKASLKAQFVLDGMHISLQRYLKTNDARVKPFGPLLTTLDSKSLASSVVLHRFLKAYEVPVNGNSTKRKVDSIAQVLERDLQGFSDYPTPDEPHKWSHFLRLRNIVNSLCGRVKPTYRLVFPTGESFTTLHGEKDLYYKLETERVWDCSPASFQYVCRIFYKNPHMRRLVKARFYQRSLEEFGRTRKVSSLKLYDEFGPNGFRIFRKMLSLLVRLTDVSRMTTVPKDNLKDRVITCEPLLTMICQLSYMQDLRDGLIKSTGLDLTVMQDWHRAFLRSGRATIDLRNASNQVWLPLISKVFPTHVAKTLLDLRTGTTQTGSDTYHHFNMYSPMGCGLTFDVMTLLLLGICRVYDPTATVFGDDIMCSESSAVDIIEALQWYGLEVNTSKSFIDGNFRESCGAYADLTNNSFIVCFDFHRPHRLTEVFTFMNKLRLIILANQIHGDLRDIFSHYWGLLSDLVPCDAFAKEHRSSLPSSCILTDATDHRLRWVWNEEWQRWAITTREYIDKVPDGRVACKATLDSVRLMMLRRHTPLSAYPPITRSTYVTQ